MASDPKKQAVLLIHGIGEQRPMDTLRGFVKAVWSSDANVQHIHASPGVFSKPDRISESFELRRLTTTKNKKGIRTDFYELYWAHLMKGIRVNPVAAWARRVLWRRPWTLPRPLLGAWVLVVGLLLILLFLALQTILPENYRILPFLRWVNGGVFGFFAGIAIPICKNIIGDAACYLDPAPGNIHIRQQIRAKAVALLQKLNASEDYDRIILVGHSLGSVIGFDMLTFAWALCNEDIDKSKLHPVLDQVEEIVAGQHQITADHVRGLKDLKVERKGGHISRAVYRQRRAALEAAFQDALAAHAAAYRQRQRELQKELQTNGIQWKVSDFLTLGSPLTHAAVLLARDQADLESKQNERELPTCPPQLESGKFSYPSGKAVRTPHHAAVFGPTRWTNLYFPARWVLLGDFIGGPLRGAFGWGIRDRPVKTRLFGGIFSHTCYWKPEKSQTASHITALREALNLLDD